MHGLPPARETPREKRLLNMYSRALDEVYTLRAALAVEALMLERHAALRTFPASRRSIVERQTERMRKAARGEVHTTRDYDQIDSVTAKNALKMAGASETLTRTEWERQQPAARGSK